MDWRLAAAMYPIDKAVLLYGCLDCSNCPAYLNSTGLATLEILTAIKKYNLKMTDAHVVFMSKEMKILDLLKGPDAYA